MPSLKLMVMVLTSLLKNLKMLKKAIWTLGGIGIGVGASAMVVANIDDVTYRSLRRNIIRPMQVLSLRKQMQDEENIVTPHEGVKDLAAGTSSFLQDIRPRALLNSNVKALLVDDKDFT